jgi:hypothetical protein
MSGIFISYRREDSAVEAHQLYRLLSAQFGADSVFLDVEDIDLGDDFPEVIDEKVGFCDALIAVIGRNWLTCADAEGRRRLDDPGDWVRLEIASALTRHMKVFPVLVGGASLPRPQDLPAAVSAVTLRNAIDLRPDRFDEDVSRLAESLAVTRKGESTAALWFSIVTRGHRALDPLDLHKPAVLWRGLEFLLYMSILDAMLHWPIMANLWSLIKYAGGECVQYVGAGFVLHLAMKAVRGKATLQKSITTMCFLTAYIPLIALAQVPVWGLNTSIVKKIASNEISISQLIQQMQAFVDALGVFGVTRMILSLLAATYLWWRFCAAVFSAFRTLHRLSKPRAMLAFGLGLAPTLVYLFFIVIPFYGPFYKG